MTTHKRIVVDVGRVHAWGDQQRIGITPRVAVSGHIKLKHNSNAALVGVLHNHGHILQTERHEARGEATDQEALLPDRTSSSPVDGVAWIPCAFLAQQWQLRYAQWERLGV